MNYTDDKKTITNFYIPIDNNKGGFSNLSEDIINSQGSKKKKIWSSPYTRYESLSEISEKNNNRTSKLIKSKKR